VGARIAIVLGLLALACSTAGGTRPGPGVSRAKARVDSIVAAVMAERHIPGVTLLVEHRGLRIVAREYGLADLENKVPAELETVYQIASLTKQFTAAAILQLVEQRKVQLRDQVTKFVPELRIRGGGHVTVHHLLSHTHGLVEYNRDETIAEFGTAITHQRILDLIGGRELEFAPGEKFRYRNSGYYLLGMIVERVSGLSYACTSSSRSACGAAANARIARLSPGALMATL
jgi:CubicO group peptidase (beta-lactamase class C family)